MPRHSGNRLRTAFFVLVGTGVSITHIGCQGAQGPEETGPSLVVLDAVGLGFADLPDGCSRVEPTEYPLELLCELIETTETPAGPAGRIRLELGEPSDFGIELDDVAKSHATYYEGLPEGDSFGGRQIIGPLGPAQYTRGQFLAEDGTTRQQIRLFMLHPIENRVVTLVYEHAAGDNADSAARINNHLLVLLGEMDLADTLVALDEDEAATEG